MSKSKVEIVYEKIHEKIIKGHYRPGSKLIIAQLAKEFKMSEIPVREAIQRLAQEGYITLRPYGAPTVNSLTEDEIRQIFEIRSSLESLAGKLAVDHISNAHIKQLEQIVEESIIIYENDDIEGFFTNNRNFHRTIYEQSNNPMLVKLIQDITDLSARYPNYYQVRNRMFESIKEHRLIIDALKDRNSDLVESLIKDHLLKVTPILIKLVREFNEQQT